MALGHFCGINLLFLDLGLNFALENNATKAAFNLKSSNNNNLNNTKIFVVINKFSNVNASN